MAPRRPTANAPTAMKQIRPIDAAVAMTCLVAAAVSIAAAPGTAGLLGAALALLMLAIAIVDYRHLLIPNELTAAALALAIVNAALAAVPSAIESVAAALLRGAVTMLFFWSLRWLYGRLRGREGLGLGDVKLAFVAGAWLEWPMIPVAVEIAALGALAAYGAWRVAGKSPIGPTSRLPFGLFFAPAIWLAWLIGTAIFGSM